MLNIYTHNIQESLKHVWHKGVGFLRYLAAKVLKGHSLLFLMLFFRCFLCCKYKVTGVFFFNCRNFLYIPSHFLSYVSFSVFLLLIFLPSVKKTMATFLS